MTVTSKVFGLLVRGYQLLISPAIYLLFGPACRYEPSCSQYALQAIRDHGTVRGSWFAARRICRCHPWGGCGCDPVPPAPRSTASS